MSYIHIHNWDRFQHRDVTRNKRAAAPWIMDYKSQLNDEEWMGLGFADRGLLQSLRLQYLANQGRGINDSTTSLARVLGHRVLRTQLERLNRAGFIEFSASKLRADLPQKARLEVEVEVEPPKPPTVKLAPIGGKRPEQVIWDALANVLGYPDSWKPTTSERGRMNRAIGELLEVDATPQEVRLRGSKYRERYPNASLTPQALTNNWGSLGPSPAEVEESQRNAAYLDAVKRQNGGAS